MTTNFEDWYTKRVRVICHIAFWLIVSLLYYLNYRRLGGDYTWIYIVKEVVVTTVMFYSISWIISQWTARGRFYPLLLFLVAGYVWWASLTYAVSYVVYHHVERDDTYFDTYLDLVLGGGFFSLFSVEMFPVFVLDYIFLVSIPVSPKLVKSLMDQANKKTRLERDHLAMELNFLKAQISPHFLFNTLNSIYRMAEKNDPLTSGTVFRLAGMMRYLLYESQDDKVLLEKELAFISAYIDLVKIKYGGNVRLEVHISPVTAPYRVTPHLLIPFVENALKHGPERSRKNAWVTIDFNLEDDRLTFKVANGVHPHIEKSPVGGVGLANVRKRLDLHYPRNYDLQIEETETAYYVNLMIKLK